MLHHHIVSLRKLAEPNKKPGYSSQLFTDLRNPKIQIYTKQDHQFLFHNTFIINTYYHTHKIPSKPSKFRTHTYEQKRIDFTSLYIYTITTVTYQDTNSQSKALKFLPTGD